MSLYRPHAGNPEEIDQEETAFRNAVDRRVKALDRHDKLIRRWFWKGLLAFNLLLWSVALPVLVLLRFG